jgi:hypothetical protein
VPLAEDAEFAASEVIRPAAVLPERKAREIFVGLEGDDARSGGRWIAKPGTWQRWDHAWPDADCPGDTVLLGSISTIYDHPHKYEVTVFRAAITHAGVRQGWTVERLCDEAFSHADLTLASCPRGQLDEPPPVYRFKER